MSQKTEKHTFQAEIQQLLDIVIHSLYTDKEIFIRELISNAADACEKLRFRQSSGEAIHQPEVDLKISIATDDQAHTITLTDTGIGMTRDELIENLGTIAHSGSKAFLKQIAEGKEKPDANLIGQFGVGFYSAFMVAETIDVVSRAHGAAEASHWHSDGSSGFSIASASREDVGTDITLHLRKDAKEYIERERIEYLVKKYSDHIAQPIMWNDAKADPERLNSAVALWTRPA
ncbi:MAG: ATP-binding protein, partial [Limisphaerales bacterium]